MPGTTPAKPTKPPPSSPAGATQSASTNSTTPPPTTTPGTNPSNTKCPITPISCAPGVIGSRSVNKNDSAQPSRQMRHTFSVEVAYHCAQQVRDVFHQATPAHGRRLAARLIESLPTCPIPEIARLGRTLRKWKDAFLAYFDTAGASHAPHRSHQRNHRTRQTNRQRLPQPHQLPTPNAPHRRRPRCLHPRSTLKSQQSPPACWLRFQEATKRTISKATSMFTPTLGTPHTSAFDYQRPVSSPQEHQEQTLLRQAQQCYHY